MKEKVRAKKVDMMEDGIGSASGKGETESWNEFENAVRMTFL